MKNISRRQALKTLTLGSFAAGLTLSACTQQAKQQSQSQSVQLDPSDLSEADQKMLQEQFFTEHEMETVRQLADLIIPADDRSGNASDAGVPEFIDFMMLDQPRHQTAMRGGLRWLDNQSLERFNQAFVDCSPNQKKQLLDDIAWPEKARPEMSQGVAFFNMFRDFTATGFWTSKIGVTDLGYMGNKATSWNGCPPAALKKLGVQYSDT